MTELTCKKCDLVYDTEKDKGLDHLKKGDYRCGVCEGKLKGKSKEEEESDYILRDLN